jgi:hypothetical protein
MIADDSAAPESRRIHATTFHATEPPFRSIARQALHQSAVFAALRRQHRKNLLLEEHWLG